MEITIDENALPDDLTQEELDDILEELQEQIDKGTLFENSVEVDMEKLYEEDPTLYKLLVERATNAKEHKTH